MCGVTVPNAPDVLRALPHNQIYPNSRGTDQSRTAAHVINTLLAARLRTVQNPMLFIAINSSSTTFSQRHVPLAGQNYTVPGRRDRATQNVWLPRQRTDQYSRKIVCRDQPKLAEAHGSTRPGSGMVRVSERSTRTPTRETPGTKPRVYPVPVSNLKPNLNLLTRTRQVPRLSRPPSRPHSHYRSVHLLASLSPQYTSSAQLDRPDSTNPSRRHVTS
ncbi:hypothetical protein R3P38DRAFT_2816228 [Favolaschia claudopus]|uniref:Uncharacterized protein n=1 Tax=Favolaschia claudopus TaxID=2862362 RepID=A0AAV9YZI4_9AGAR